MEWRRRRETERLTEWEREDGRATVRVRERPDGRWAVRLDVLYQADDGPAYRRRDADTAAEARELAATWTDGAAGAE